MVEALCVKDGGCEFGQFLVHALLRTTLGSPALAFLLRCQTTRAGHHPTFLFDCAFISSTTLFASASGSAALVSKATTASCACMPRPDFATKFLRAVFLACELTCRTKFCLSPTFSPASTRVVHLHLRACRRELRDVRA